MSDVTVKEEDIKNAVYYIARTEEHIKNCERELFEARDYLQYLRNMLGVGTVR